MNIHAYKERVFVPQCFLMVYKTNEGEYYLEGGDVLHNRQTNQYTLGVTKPVDELFLSELVDAIKQDHFEPLKWKGFIPKNVLYCDASKREPKLIWYQEPKHMYLYFSDETKIESALYRMPPLIFKLEQSELFVYRLSTDDVNPDVLLYHLPLPNIYEDAKICLGEAKSKRRKNKTLDDVMQFYIDVFYKTEFNSLHHEIPLPNGEIYVSYLNANKDLNQWPLTPINKLTLKKLL